MPNRRHEFEELPQRGAYWNLILSLLEITHKNRFPTGRKFGADLPLMVLYGFTIATYSKGRLVHAADVERSLQIPHQTVTRYLRELVEINLVEKTDGGFRPSRKVARRTSSGPALSNRLLRQTIRTLEALEQAIPGLQR